MAYGGAAGFCLQTDVYCMEAYGTCLPIDIDCVWAYGFSWSSGEGLATGRKMRQEELSSGVGWGAESRGWLQSRCQVTNPFVNQ